MGPGASVASWSATSSPSRVTRTCPEGIVTTCTVLPMQARGTDHCLPAARTSMVAGTFWTLTLPTISCRRRRLPMGRSRSFSRMNSTAGGSPVVSLGSALLRASMRDGVDDAPLPDEVVVVGEQPVHEAVGGLVLPLGLRRAHLAQLEREPGLLREAPRALRFDALAAQEGDQGGHVVGASPPRGCRRIARRWRAGTRAGRPRCASSSR